MIRRSDRSIDILSFWGLTSKQQRILSRKQKQKTHEDKQKRYIFWGRVCYDHSISIKIEDRRVTNAFLFLYTVEISAKETFLGRRYLLFVLSFFSLILFSALRRCRITLRPNNFLLLLCEDQQFVFSFDTNEKWNRSDISSSVSDELS